MSYLERLALELPGWSGMFLWRHLHPGYDGETAAVDMMDYLAVRMVLERIYAQRLARNQCRSNPVLMAFVGTSATIVQSFWCATLFSTATFRSIWSICQSG